MSSFHNNQLNMVSLFDHEYVDRPAQLPPKMIFNMDTDGPEPFNPVDDFYDEKVMVKQEPDGEVSYTPSFSSEDGESEFGSRRSSRIPSRTPKINKDGAPRKPRQPRPKLLKWSDNDWKNVVLGIIWACGETGVQIPFDQAAQVVGDNCTAGAMQQAILKLRQKQMDAGYQIPPLRMAWTRKNRNSSSSLSSANPKTAQRSSNSNTANPIADPVGRRSRIVKLKIKRLSELAPVPHSAPIKIPSPPPKGQVDPQCWPRGSPAEPTGYPKNTVRGPEAPINDESVFASGLFFDMSGQEPTDGLMHRPWDEETRLQPHQHLNYPAYMAPDAFTTGLEDIFGEVEDYGFEFP